MGKRDVAKQFVYAFAIGFLVCALLVVFLDKGIVYRVYMTGKGGDANGIHLLTSECNDANTEMGKIICAGEEVRKIYSFTEAHDGVQEVDYTIKHGGVCKDYALLWKEIADHYGLKSKYVHYDIGDGGHVFTMIYSTDGYCIADQENVNCYKIYIN